MTIIADRYVDADTLSEGWLEAVRVLRSVASRKTVHLLVRIRRPEVEDPQIRGDAQRLIDEYNATKSESQWLYDITTTRNTIFPAAWARKRPDPANLADYYRRQYTKAGLRGVKHNSHGTYFGRIVAYPRQQGDPADQLTDTVRKLKDELEKHTNKSSRYEINIYNERKDTSPMSFPCLAHLSVHQHEGHLHLQAIYRNEYLVGRAYGNYLGLAELQAYMAAASGLKIGELLVTIGHAELDGHLRTIDEMLARHPAPTEQ
jgi:thymidylate synthase